MIRSILMFGIALALVACSAAGPDSAAEGAAQHAAADTVCDLSQISGTFTTADAFVADSGTCPVGSVGTVAFSTEYDIAEGAKNCAGPGGHTQTVSADGCTVTETCAYVAPTESRLVTLVETWAPDLGSFAGTLTVTPTNSDACSGEWTFSGSK